MSPHPDNLNNSSPDDSDCMRRLQAGERSAFEPLLDRYEKAVLNFALRLGLPFADAEDATQEVFLRVYRAKDNFAISRPFRPWLFTIAARVISNRLRAKKRNATLSLDVGTNEEGSRLVLESSENSPATVLEKNQTLLRVQRALDSLPEKQRAALLLVVYDQMSYEEAALSLSLSLASIKSLLFRARKTLQEILSD